MQRFVRSSVVRALLQDPLSILRPITVGGPHFRPYQRFTFDVNSPLSSWCLFTPAKRAMKIYTGTGDKGTSALFTGERRPKTDPVFSALGSVDELSCAIAMAIAQIDQYADKTIQKNYDMQQLCDQLDLIQRRLQAVGSCVATPIPSSSQLNQSKSELAAKRRARYAHVDFPEDAASLELEAWIDAMTAILPPLRQFILPSGGLPGTALHFARAICRRAERYIVALNAEQEMVEPAVIIYMNRLSDYLFTAARYVSCGLGLPEKLYTAPRSPKSS